MNIEDSVPAQHGVRVRPIAFTKAYKAYVLSTLTLVYTLSQLDSNLIYLLLEPIKTDLSLSDSQLGLLTGIAFALFYATLGVPIARWTDRGNRSTITSIAIGLWGMTVMLCLFVTSFFHLILARMTAAIGGSGCMPPTYSLVGDYFPGSGERTRAMATYMLAVPLSAILSFVLGGFLADLYGWRITLFLTGIPGIVVSILVKATIAEPRAHPSAAPESDLGQPAMTDVLRLLWRQSSSRHLSIAVVLFFILGNGVGPWYAAFMTRSHGMTTAELGVWLGLIFGVGGIGGNLLGGFVNARWFGDNERGQMRLCAAMVAFLVPCFFLFLLLPQRYGALCALMPLVVAWNFIFGPMFSMLQRLVIPEMRATTLAVVMLFANLIGMGLGPQVVGGLSDLLRPALGDNSLRYAMLAMSSIALLSAYHFWHVAKTVNADLVSVVHCNQYNPNPAASRGNLNQPPAR